jgi:hypothetical protein
MTSQRLCRPFSSKISILVGEGTAPTRDILASTLNVTDVSTYVWMGQRLLWNKEESVTPREPIA